MMAKLLLVVCFQAVLLKVISAQAYGIYSPGCGCSNAVPTITVSSCGCSGSIPVSAPSCGCYESVNTIAVPSCGCSNAVNNIAVPSCGCSNAVNNIAVPSCGCSNAVNNFAVPSCGCSNSVNTITVPSCGCSNGINNIAVPNCGCSNAVNNLAVSGCGCSNAVNNVAVSNCGCSGSNYGFSRTTTASSGGPLTVTCYGPLSTNGVSVLAELGIQGDVEVTGTLPFLSAVVLEGNLPTSGMANVNYGCGDGNIVIQQENGNPNGRNAASSSGLNLASLGVGSCGCRSY